jgi:phosphate:Na+ symporter
MEFHFVMLAVDQPNPNWFKLAMGLAGGLALFLFGLDQLSVGLKQAAGDSLKTLLTRLTTNRFLGVITGAVITGVLNSSTVTTVLVVGFVTAGVMTLSQSVAVIMGANIGSTVTAQVLAFNLAAYSLLPVAVGFLLIFTAKRKAVENWGMMIMGLGLVFYGMGLMSDAMKPLRTYQPFINLLASMEKPIYGILAGILFTALVQSSAATLGLAIALASDGLLSLPAGIALALGANIGTCGTALLAAIGKPPEAIRASLIHVLFNVLGVAIWLPMIGLLAKFAIAVSPSSETSSGSGLALADVPRQIANANTAFNIINTAIFICFTGAFARLATWIVPDRAKPTTTVKPRFMDSAALGVPTVALEQVRQELARLGDDACTMLKELRPREGSLGATAVANIGTRADDVEALQTIVLEYLARIHAEKLTKQQSDEHIALMTIAVHYREISELIEDSLVSAVQRALSDPALLSMLEVPVLGELYRAVVNAAEHAVSAVRKRDRAMAESVSQMSAEVRELANTLMSRLAVRMDPGDPDKLFALRLQTTFVDGLRHIFTLNKRIARNAAVGEWA